MQFRPSLCKVDTGGSYLFLVSDLNLAHLWSLIECSCYIEEEEEKETFIDLYRSG